MKEVANEEKISLVTVNLKTCYHKSCIAKYLHAFITRRQKTVCMKILKILANLEDHKSKKGSCLLKFYEGCQSIFSWKNPFKMPVNKKHK